MRKLYYIDKLETELNMPEIEERIREIVSENQVFDIGVMSKKTHRVEVKENIISFSYLSKGRSGRQCALFYLFCCGLYFWNPDSEEALQQFV